MKSSAQQITTNRYKIKSKMVDGVNLSIKLTESQALRIIGNYGLEYNFFPNDTETNFRYRNSFRDLIIDIRYKNSNWEMIIRGSLQKFYEGNNCNDFSITQVDDAIQSLQQEFHLDVVEMHHGKMRSSKIVFELDKLEIGMNVDFPVENLSTFLKNNLRQHKDVCFTCDDGLTHVCKHDKFSLKYYQKGEYLLRVEMVFSKRELKKYGVLKLEHLLQTDKKDLLISRFRKEVSQVIYKEGINLHNPKNLTKEEQRKLLMATNPWYHNDYIEDLKKLTGREKKNMNQRKYRLNRAMKDILVKKGNGMKQFLIEKIDKKIEQITSRQNIET